MSTLKLALGAVLVACAVGCVSAPKPTVVDRVTPDQLAGHWYEVARIPHLWDGNQVANTYTITPHGSRELLIVTRYHYDVTYGWENEKAGTLHYVGRDESGKMKVRYGPSEGDWWVLAIDPDSRYAMIGSEDRRWLWILSKTPTLPNNIDDRLYAMADRMGYNIASLRRTPQLMNDNLAGGTVVVDAASAKSAGVASAK